MANMAHRGSVSARSFRILLATLVVATSLSLLSTAVRFVGVQYRQQSSADPHDSLLATATAARRGPAPAECSGAALAAAGPVASGASAAPAASAAPVASGVVSREWLVVLGKDSAEITGNVTLRRCSEELLQLSAVMPEALRRWHGTGSDIVSHVLGGIAIDYEDVTFAPPQVRAGVAGSADTSLAWHAVVPLRGEALNTQPVNVRLAQAGWPAQTQLRVTAKPPSGLWLEGPTAGLWPGRPSEGELQASLPPDFHVVEVISARASAPAASAAKAGSAASAAREATQPGAAERLLSPLGSGLIQMFPFLAVLLWMRRLRDPATPALAQQERANELALALVLAIMLGALVHEIVRAMAAAFAAPNDWRWDGYPARALLVAFLWPLLTLVWRRERMARVPVPLAAGLLVLAAGLLAASLELSPLDPETGLKPSLEIFGSRSPLGLAKVGDAGPAPLVTALCALVIGAGWLGLECAGWRGVLIAPPVSVGVALLLQAAESSHWLWAVPARLAGALLVLPAGWVFGRWTVRWLRALRNEPESPVPLVAGVIGAAVAAVLAQPASGLDSPYVVWLATLPADAVASAWSLLAIASVPVWLYRRQAGSERLRRDHIDAAVALLLLVFSWRNGSSLLGTLARMVVGYLLAAHWLFAARPIRWPRQRGGRLLDKAIGELSALNELWRMRRALSRTIADKVGKMELTVQDGIARTLQVDRFIGTRAVTGVLARGQAALALNRGSSERPWVRGIRAAVASSILSLPWIGSYLFSVRQQPLPDMPATAVVQYVSVLLGLLQWPALGFVFLYFYPHLRGRNGIQKGLVLGTVLVLPAVVGNLFSTESLQHQWLGFVYWALQVFICCMTVGVGLGDIVVLRLAGKRWRSIIEIYNAGTLAAWSSTLTLAVAGALTAAVAGGAGQVASAVITQMIGAPVVGHPHQ